MNARPLPIADKTRELVALAFRLSDSPHGPTRRELRLLAESLEALADVVETLERRALARD
jgi:hypothetical protein